MHNNLGRSGARLQMKNKQGHRIQKGRRKHSITNMRVIATIKGYNRARVKHNGTTTPKENRQQNVLKSAKGIIFPFMSFSLSFA